MIDPFSIESRRDPYPFYSQLRQAAPVVRAPQTGMWAVFDYATVKRVLTDVAMFSSRFGPDWMIFSDPPRHTLRRALVAKVFTPRSVANLEGQVIQLSRSLLHPHLPRGEMDLASDYAARLPLLVISQMLGIPAADQVRFQQWNDVILRMSFTIARHDETSAAAMDAFTDVTVEMSDYLSFVLKQRGPDAGDLLARLAGAEIDGERLTHSDILGFFQLLLLAGSETTTNLISNMMLCFAEHPGQFEKLKSDHALLAGAIEETLRYRSPLQWVYRLTREPVALHGQRIPARALILAVIGSANRDESQFADADRFDIARDPNPHIAFGTAIHFCMGAALARLEARIAWTHLLKLRSLCRADNEQWTPREGLNVHGPQNLRVRFDPVTV